MPIPVVSTVKKLPPGPRAFLFFSGFNLVSWQCIIGPAMVLFARHLHMPASWVGWLLAFLPLANLLIVGMVPLVTRMGPKRLMLSTWGARNVAVSSVLLMPFVVDRFGERAGWYLLVGATLSFCVIRAIGSGGWLPWVHEICPDDRRGTFFSAEASIVYFLNIFVILGQGLLLEGDPGTGRFLGFYAFGICAGLLSLVWMSRIPGGKGKSADTPSREKFSAYLIAFRDARFLALVGFATAAYTAVTFYTASQVMYLRDALHLGPNVIMVVLAIASAAVVLSVGAWSNFTEHSGSGAALRLTMVAFSAAILGLWAIDPAAKWAPYATVPCMAAASAFSVAGFAAANRAMLNFTRPEAKVAYTNLWSVGTSLALGLSPIAAGEIIERFGATGFEVCFATSGFLAMLCAALAVVVIPDATHATHDAHRRPALRPDRSLRDLAHAAAITVGLHESNRTE